MQWFPVEWLWGVLIYLAYTITHSYTGLEIITGMIVAGTFIFQLSTMRLLRIETPIAVLVTLISLLTALGRIVPRPQIVTALGLSATTFFLYRLHDSDKIYRKSLFILPIIFVLWANIHPGVLTGLMLIGLALVVELLAIILSKSGFIKSTEQSSGPPSLKFRRLLVIALICTLAVLINPHGIGTYFYIYQHAQMKFLSAIYEWDSPFASPTPMGQLWFYKSLLILGATSLYYSYKKKDPLPAVLYLAYAIYSFRAIRLIGEFAIVAAPGTALGVREILASIRAEKFQQFITGRIPTVCIIIITTVLICYVPGDRFYSTMNLQDHAGTGIDSNAFPLPMLDFMQRENIRGQPFNEFGIGGILLWEFPDMKDFIDSRDLNDTIGYLYASMYNLQPGFEKKFAVFGIDHVMTYIPGQERDAGLMSTSPIPYFSTHRDDWKLVFWDDRSTLYLKNIPKFKEIIERSEYKVIHPYLFAYRPRVFDLLRSALPVDFQLELSRKLREETNGRIIRFITGETGQVSPSSR